jgi:hypothetical protein
MDRKLRAFGLAVMLSLGAALAAPVIASADPPDTHEYLANRPSGFWTSNRPAVGGAYRYRLLGIGVLISTGMGVFAWRLVRRADATRAIRDAATPPEAPRASPRSS